MNTSCETCASPNTAGNNAATPPSQARPLGPVVTKESHTIHWRPEPLIAASRAPRLPWTSWMATM
eukprot:4204181-Lingulodinium_polyedra.AAC.1